MQDNRLPVYKCKQKKHGKCYSNFHCVIKTVHEIYYMYKLVLSSGGTYLTVICLCYGSDTMCLYWVIYSNQEINNHIYNQFKINISCAFWSWSKCFIGIYQCDLLLSFKIWEEFLPDPVFILTVSMEQKLCKWLQ